MRTIILSLTFLFAALSAWGQRQCPYCNGTGKIVKNISVSQYGINRETKVKCSECGIYYLPSTGHSHIHCSHCGGTGRMSGSSGSSRHSGETYDPDSPEGIWAKGVAMTIKYGLPYTDEEKAAVERLGKSSPTMAQLWIKYRNILNMGTSYFNEQNAKIGYRWDKVASVDIIKNGYDKQLAEIAPSLELPSDLYAIYQRLYKSYQDAYTTYRNNTNASESLQNLQNRLDDYILQQNLLY
ncbi:hypothetical protein [Bacteroides sp.]